MYALSTRSPKFWLLMGKLIRVGFICAFIVSGTGCQLFINVLAGTMAAEAVKKGDTSGTDPDKEPYQPPAPHEQCYLYSQYWEEKGDLEQALQEMQKFIKLAPDDPRGPERLEMLKARLTSEKEMDTQQSSPSQD